MKKAVVLGQIRHGLTALGTYFVAEGSMNADTLKLIVGGVCALIGFVWSMLAPEKKEAGK